MPVLAVHGILDWGLEGRPLHNFTSTGHFFFTVQEVCDNGALGRAALLRTMSPWCNGGPNFVGNQGFLDLTESIDDLSMGWDHACNIVVILPQNRDTYRVNQISEYDGQQRYQPSYQLAEGWKKVPGVGGLDFGLFNPLWPNGQELYCGSQCAFYSLEELENVPSDTPRFLIGRNYRTGSVMLNITDTLQLQSLSWNPFLMMSNPNENQFIGIGLCCSSDWCHPDCQGKEGQLVLISFLPGASSVDILAVIGDYDSTTVRLGVEFSPAPVYPIGTHEEAYVFHHNSIITFSLLVVPKKGVVLQAKKINQSPPVAPTFGEIAFWANGLS